VANQLVAVRVLSRVPVYPRLCGV